MASDKRAVIGYYDRSISTINDEDDRSAKGFIKIMFEEIDGEIHLINKHQLFDESEEVFQQTGFHTCYVRNLKSFIKVDVVENNNRTRENHTDFVTFKENVRPIRPVEIFSIIKMTLPDSMDLEVSFDALPHTKLFFLLDNGAVYGPFSYELDAQLKSNLEKEPQLQGPFHTKLRPHSPKEIGVANLNNSFIMKFSFDEILAIDGMQLNEVNGIYYLSNWDKRQGLNISGHPYVTKQDIINYMQQLANERAVPKALLPPLKKALNTSKLVFTPEGKDLVYRIVKEATEKDEYVKVLMNVISNDDTGKQVFESYLKEKRDDYVSQWDKEAKKRHKDIAQTLEDKKVEFDKLLQAISKKEQELTNLKNNISTLSEEQGNISDEVSHQSSPLHEAVDQQLKEKKEQLTTLKKELGQYQNLNQLNEDIRKQELKMDLLNDQKSRVNQSLEDVKSMLSEGENKLQAKLREMIPFVSSIIQAPFKENEAIQVLKSPRQVNHQILTDMTEAKEIVAESINAVANKFSVEFNRSYSNEFIASVIVASMQSFLTIFAGPPGLGKTSFVRLLHSILGLNDRFHEVPVSRSWVSEREFIGFFNSLTNSFSPSSSGVYGFFKGISKDDEETVPLSIMLLDEANLSPIEHYGASLLNMADDESERAIRLTSDTVKLPNNLRVMATINHDMTTEPLSDRLIDRAPVIPFDTLIQEEANCYEGKIDLCFSYSLLSQVFGEKSILIDESETDAHQVRSILQSVFDIIGSNKPEYGKPFIASFRKQKKVKNYIKVLTQVLAASCKMNLHIANITALDFAILYYLLPKVNGSGIGTKRRLTDLLTIIEGHEMPRSAAKLNDMIVRGEQHLDTFNFFHY